jgi:hypothetical protein
MVSMTGERVVVTETAEPILAPANAVSQNWLVSRTGINLVIFFGSAA